MWKNVARVVGVAAAPTIAVSNAAFCSACTATPSLQTPSSASVRATSCTCQQATAIQHRNSFGRGKPVSWEIDDWEFAGDEEKDYYVFGTPPSITEVEEATADLRSALRLGMVAAPAGPRVERPPSPLSSVIEIAEVSSVTAVGDEEGETSSALMPLQPDWMEPPESLELTTTVPREETTGAPSSAMLEAFYQFQHNPQIQGLVLSLATDKTVWEAVLANQKIQEFRHALLEVEGTTTPAAGSASSETTQSSKSSNIFSRLYWSTKTAFDNFIKQFQDFMSSLFETAADKNVLSGNEKGNTVFEWSVKACMMLAVVVLAIVVFKRSAVVRRG
jgi:hypothetical protein